MFACEEVKIYVELVSLCIMSLAMPQKFEKVLDYLKCRNVVHKLIMSYIN